MAGGRGRRASLARARPRRLALPPPVRLLPARRRDGERVVAADFVRDRRRLGPRPPGPGLRRGRRRGRPGGGPRRCSTRSAPTARSTIGSPPLARAVREGRRPRDHRRPPQPAACWSPRSRTSTATPTAGGAARRCIYWAKTSWFVRTVGAPRRPAAARTSASAGTPSTSSTAASASGWRATSTGRSPGTATGARRCRSGAAATRPRHLHRLGRRARRAGRARPGRPRPPPPGRRRRHLRLPAPRAATRTPARLAPGARRLVRLGIDAVRAAPPPVRRRRTRFASSFPADFICEAIDQTRGWFYSLLAVNTLVFGSTPYRNVVCLGLIVDAQGQKMSKSRGNVVDPWRDLRPPRRRRRCAGTSSRPARRGRPGGSPTTASARRPGRRCSRSGTSSPSSPPTPTSTAGTPGGRRRRRRGADPRPRPLDPRRARRRRRRRHRGPRGLRRPRRAPTRLARFVDDLSNWYVRRSRRRFWKASEAAAHATLHHVPGDDGPAAGPVLPVPGRRGAPRPAPAARSVHLADWPRPSGAADRGAGRAHGRGPAARRPRPGGPHRRQGQGAPAAAAGAAPPPRRGARRRRAGRDRATSST